MTAEPGSYEVKRLGEMERAFGGALARVRAELGITAFGVQVVDLPPNSGELAPEHDHLRKNRCGNIHCCSSIHCAIQRWTSGLSTRSSGAMNPSSDIVTLKNTFPAISPQLPSERSR
jgi:hypothetical protein